MSFSGFPRKTPAWLGALTGLFSGLTGFQQARQQTALLKREQDQQDADRAAQEQDRALRTQALQENLRQAKGAPFLGFLKTAAEQYPAPEDQLALGQRAADLSSGQTVIGPQNAPAAPMTPFDARGSGPVTNDYAAAHPYPAQVTNPLAGLTLHETAKQQADADEQKKGLEQLLLHAYGQGPENPGAIGGALQSLYATGHLPQVDTQVPLPVGAPGLPGGVSVPTPVKGPVSLSDVLASGGKSAAERALAQKATEAEANRGSRERIAAISAASKQYKSWDDLKRDLTKEWLKGGGNAWEFQPYLDAQREEWNRDHPTAAPVPAPPPPAEGAAAPPPLVLPGAAAKIKLQGAQAGVANARATNIPIEEQRKQTADLARTQIAQARQKTFQQATDARGKSYEAAAAYQQGKLTLDQAELARKQAKDATDKWLGTERNRIAQLRATLDRSSASPQTAALRSQLAGLEKTRAQLQGQYNVYDKQQFGATTGAGGGTVDPKLAAAADQKAKDLQAQISAVDGQIAGVLGKTRTAAPRSAATGGAPALPESTFSPSTAMPTASAGSLSQKRSQAQARFQSKWGLTPDEARRRAVQLFPGP